MTGQLGDNLPPTNDTGANADSVVDTAQAIPRVEAPLAQDQFAAGAASSTAANGHANSLHDSDAEMGFGSGVAEEYDEYGLKKDRKVLFPGLVAKMNPGVQRFIYRMGWWLPALIVAMLLIIAISVAGHFATRSLAPNDWIGHGGHFKQDTVPNSKGDNAESAGTGSSNLEKSGESGKLEGAEGQDSDTSIDNGSAASDPNATTFRQRQIIGAPPVASASGSKAIPEGAVSVSQFSTPDNNIQCEISQAGVNCIMNQYDFDFGCSQGGKGAVSILIQGPQGFVPDCYDPTNVRWPSLGTNQTTAFAPFACTVIESGGISCWNASSGWGFSMSRNGVQQYMPSNN